MTVALRIVDPLPEAVDIIDPLWITMSDGCRLAARLWLPKSAHAKPVPAILEYIPTIHRDRGAYRLHDIDLTVDGGAVERFSITEGDPLSAKGDVVWRHRMTRGDWDIRSESRTVLTASKDTFHLRAWLDAFEGETRVFSKNWSFDIPRDGV